MFRNAYPYTDLHELNLDYILDQMNQLDLDIQGIEERATATATQEAKEYVEQELLSVKSEMTQLRAELENGIAEVHETADDIDTRFNNYINNMEARFSLLRSRVEEVESHIDNAVSGVNARTDIVVNRMHDTILSEISAGLVSERVINYFTGQTMTVQDMIDYLCYTFHGSNGAAISAIVADDDTVTNYINKDHTVSEWVLNGGTYL